MISGIGLYLKLCLDYHRHYLRNQLNLKFDKRFTERLKTIKSSAIITSIFSGLGITKKECTEYCPRKFIVCGNWKMNGNRGDVKRIVCSLKKSKKIDPDIDIVIAVPSVYLLLAKKYVGNNIYIAAQNIYKVSVGDFTGEISAAMLHDIGIEWVILGDYDRRIIFGESDELIGDKIEDALCDGIRVIACVVERKEDSENGKPEEALFRQLKAICEAVDDWCEIVLAYEPIWTFQEEITPKRIQQMHCQIREWLRENVSERLAANTRIIYAGNVDNKNAKEIAELKDVDGFLIGEKSLTEEFSKIVTTKVKKNKQGQCLDNDQK